MSAGTVTQPVAENAQKVAQSKKLFIIGCPRSGTTWMQLLLAQHPDVATAPETQIFAYYLEPMRRQWRQELALGRSGSAGLSRLLSEQQFEELCRINAEFVLERILARNPDAHLIAEKSPKHALQADFIQRLFPDAYFLHVVRDPRDAAASLIAASGGWGADWAPHHIVDAARMWNDHVRAARQARNERGQFLEVKYEDLLANTAGNLLAIHEWLGLSTSAQSCADAVAACDFSRLKGDNGKDANMPLPSSKSPKEFFRSGVAGSGLRDLSAGQILALEHICGDTMDELGYARVGKARSTTRLRIAAHDGLFRVREGVDWQLQRLLRRV
jgi:hypothetical protein